MRVTKANLRRIVKKALHEIAHIPPGGDWRPISPGSSFVKSTSKGHVLEDARSSARSAHEFAINTQRYKHLGPGNLTKSWNGLDSFARELAGILVPELLAYAKGVSAEKSQTFEELLDYSIDSNQDRIEKLIKHTDQLVGNIGKYMGMFDELIEDSDGDALEILARLEGVGAVQRERIKFLIEKHYGHKIYGTGAKKLSPEQEEYRQDAAALFKTRADREHERRQLQAQRAKQVQSRDDATPPEGTRRPKP